ncbi:unnamed protein product [Phytophthora fragariaefolia]|uniref:Unnamed protein product n=1 Tax=Phytophthora fragariaefolia TaxID=1490495 RepID=A0A9W6Y7J5_9STRA|nr:unnamed protein product [Phytophthora fragariaefolia]
MSQLSHPTDSFLRPSFASSPHPGPMSSSGPPPPSSTSNTAASAPSSGSDAAPRFLPPVVDLVPPGADHSSLRSTLEIISTTLERTEAYDAPDHAALQQANRASRSWVQALEAKLQGAADAASPFVQFYQQRGHQGLARPDRQVGVAGGHTPVFGLRAIPQQAQRTHQLEAGLAQAQAEREASETALGRSQEDNHALESSQQALKASTQQLRRQIDTLERRVSDLRDEKDRQGTKLRVQLTCVEADSDQLRDQVDRLTSQSATAANELRVDFGDRGRIATELRSSRNTLAFLIASVVTVTATREDSGSATRTQMATRDAGDRPAIAIPLFVPLDARLIDCFGSPRPKLGR